MATIRNARTAFALAAAALLGACSSSGEGGLGEAGGILVGVVGGLLEEDDKPPPPAKIDRTMAEKYPFASIGVTIDNNPQFLFLLANQTETDEMYTLGYQVSMVLRGGRLIRTQGLARDLLGGRWEGQDLVKAAVGASGPVQGVRWFETAERGVATHTAECVAQDFGEETITILGAPLVTRHVSEVCDVEDMKWHFRNEFWITPADGRVWLSLQYVHPRINPVLIETFRPAK